MTHSQALPLPALSCPLCGAANECAAAQSGSFDTPCWCHDDPRDEPTLAAIRDLCERLPYDGGNPGVSGIRDWWIRYFDWV